MALKYRELMEILKKMPNRNLDDDVTITMYGRFYGARAVEYADEYELANDVLDNGHMFIIVNQDGEAHD